MFASVNVTAWTVPIADMTKDKKERYKGKAKGENESIKKEYRWIERKG